jgi:carbamoyl-phosphate synthase small subunit
MSIEGLIEQRRPAVLVLADGSVFPGVSIGAQGQTVGEVVFNTAMTGYQEILTDPSYAEQIVTLTYPHIGNVGVNMTDAESDRVHAAGLVIRELSPIVSSWRGEQSLGDYLQSQNIVAIADIDTRRLTRILREKGAQAGCIMTGGLDPRKALAVAQQYHGLEGEDLAKQVSTKAVKQWAQGTYQLDAQQFSQVEERFKVVVYDFGVKREILRGDQRLLSSSSFWAT